MNLHGIARGAVGLVNPEVEVSVAASAGYTTNARGARVSTYAAPVTVLAQVQPLQGDDLRQMDGITIQGERRKIFVSGRLNGMNREDGVGGDLVTLPDGTAWKVAVVVEAWPDWTGAVIVRQDDE